MKMHEEFWNAYMDLGYSVADAFEAATADIRALQRIVRMDYSDAGIWSV